MTLKLIGKHEISIRSFDCSSLESRDKTKCHYGNKTFDAGENYHNQQIESSCTIGCSCRGAEDDLSMASFTCTHIDCPEFFGGPPTQPGKKCINQHENNSCCISGTVCGEFPTSQPNHGFYCFCHSGEDLNKLAKCQFNGKTYYEGERMDSGRACYTCICGKDYEDKPIEENKHCRKVNCNMELHYYKRIAQGCIPVYYKTDDCCPIDWRCPDKETKVIADSARKDAPAENSSLKCSFGDLKMNVGDLLTPAENANQCTICTCKLPPMAHCIQTCD